MEKLRINQFEKLIQLAQPHCTERADRGIL